MIDIGPRLQHARPRMIANSRAILGRHHDAEDAVQDAAVRAIQKVGSLERIDSFGAWLRTIGRNQSITKRHQLSRYRLVEPEYFDLAGGVVDGREQMERLSTRNRINAALEDVPDSLRGAVIKRDVLGYSYAEIAEDLGIKLSAAKMRVARGRAAFRDAYLAEAA